MCVLPPPDIVLFVQAAAFAFQAAEFGCGFEFGQGGGRELPYSDSTFGRIRCPTFTD